VEYLIAGRTGERAKGCFLMVYKRIPFSGKILLSGRGKTYILSFFPVKVSAKLKS
jgi:hypothetical protein